MFFPSQIGIGDADVTKLGSIPEVAAWSGFALGARGVQRAGPGRWTVHHGGRRLVEHHRAGQGARRPAARPDPRRRDGRQRAGGEARRPRREDPDVPRLHTGRLRGDRQRTNAAARRPAPRPGHHDEDRRRHPHAPRLRAHLRHRARDLPQPGLLRPAPRPDGDLLHERPRALAPRRGRPAGLPAARRGGLRPGGHPGQGPQRRRQAGPELDRRGAHRAPPLRRGRRAGVAGPHRPGLRPLDAGRVRRRPGAQRHGPRPAGAGDRAGPPARDRRRRGDRDGGGDDLRPLGPVPDRAGPPARPRPRLPPAAGLPARRGGRRARRDGGHGGRRLVADDARRRCAEAACGGPGWWARPRGPGHRCRPPSAPAWPSSRREGAGAPSRCARRSRPRPRPCSASSRATTLVGGINDALHDPARSGRTWKLEAEPNSADQVLHPPAVPGPGGHGPGLPLRRHGQGQGRPLLRPRPGEGRGALRRAPRPPARSATTRR